VGDGDEDVDWSGYRYCDVWRKKRKVDLSLVLRTDEEWSRRRSSDVMELLGWRGGRKEGYSRPRASKGSSV
jgi:hypothetical protein